MIRYVFTMLCMALFVFFVQFNAAVAEDNSLRFAVLPVADVLPIYVAESEGYFTEQGVEVEILSAGSAVARDQLVQAGRVDGLINEVGGAALFNRNSEQMKIVSYARVPLANAPLFRVLAAPGSSMASMKDLAGVDVAVSRNTVIEYITRRLFDAEGIAADKINFSSVPVLPERMQLLLAGQIPAATLPDPLAFAALQAGAVEIVNDLTLPQLSASVLSFTQTAVDDKNAAVAGFIHAWGKAVSAINSDPEKYHSLMLKKIRIPKNVQRTFKVPPFPIPSVPTEAQWEDVNQWLLERNLLENKVAYRLSVTDEFVH